MNQKLFHRVKWYNFLFIILGLALCSAIVIGDYICHVNKNVITQVLCGISTDFSGEGVEEANALGDDLCREMAGDSFVLLKNNNCLPLSRDNKKVNLFGWSATNQGFLLKGIGSGSSTINDDKKVTLLDAFDEYGAEYNQDIISLYNNFYPNERSKDAGTHYLLPELKTSSLSSLTSSAQTFSRTAIVVVSRLSGENADDNCPKTQSLKTESGDETVNNKTYLEMTKYEDELITYCSQNFDKVILLVNSTNIMHLTSAADDRVDAVLYVGILGQSGAASIPKVLWGDINPSGRTADTYTFSPNTEASFVNSTVLNNNVQYSEDIYIGYKWYETADEMGYWNNINNVYGSKYDGVVQYPFGHGKSYTEFSWTLKSVSSPSGSTLDATTLINVVVTVKNIGDKKGKDVVELYGKAPYNQGGIEKSSIVLLDFAKTVELEPEHSQDVTLSFRGYDLASYDCYDRNNNGFKGYELEGGTYHVQLKSNVHSLKESMSNNDLTYQVASTGIKITNDPDTGVAVTNKFTGTDAYANCPIDGSSVGLSQSYLSRNNFAGTFPNVTAPVPTNTNAVNNAANYVNSSMNSSVMPTSGNDNGLSLTTLEDGTYPSYSQLDGSSPATLKYNEDLLSELSDYNSPRWDELLDQLTLSEMKDLVENGGFQTIAVPSIGKPKTEEKDGPAGFNANVGGGAELATKWTAYPCEILIGCSWNKHMTYLMGLSIGMEGQSTGMNAIYAPGVNLHRSAYAGRNYEYYSEDGVISGKLASEAIRGAKTNGITMYLKHFVCDQNGKNPQNKNTWMSEQALRENYLKPFEICAKGEANAMMSAFNRLGAVWCGANYNLCNGVLRNEWGFEGSIVTDWYQKHYMYANKAVRAGNDMLLNMNGTSAVGGVLSVSNTTDMSCAKIAAKHILYTYVDTIHFALTTNPDDSRYQTDVGISIQEGVFAWWIPVLVGLNVFIFIGADLLILRFGLPLNRTKKLKTNKAGKENEN